MPDTPSRLYLSVSSSSQVRPILIIRVSHTHLLHGQGRVMPMSSLPPAMFQGGCLSQRSRAGAHRSAQAGSSSARPCISFHFRGSMTRKRPLGLGFDGQHV